MSEIDHVAIARASFSSDESTEDQILKELKKQTELQEAMVTELRDINKRLYEVMSSIDKVEESLSK